MTTGCGLGWKLPGDVVPDPGGHFVSRDSHSDAVRRCPARRKICSRIMMHDRSWALRERASSNPEEALSNRFLLCSYNFAARDI